MRPDQQVEVSLYLRSRPSDERTEESDRGHLSHEEYEERCGASQEDLDLVRQFAAEYGLRVVEASSAKRLVRLTGAAKQLNRAFGVTLMEFERRGGSHRGHYGDVHLPEHLHKIVVGVLGLDDRPMARRHARKARQIQQKAAVGPDNLPPGAFTPPQIAQVYDFPPGLDGEGQCIAIIELEGGYRQEDFETYFQGLGIALPEIVAVGKNDPGPRHKPHRANMEVALDVEVAGAVAPKAKHVLYFAEGNTGSGFVNVVNEAIQDRVHRPSVISISWGAPEVAWPERGALIMNHVVESAAALGITVLIASGDSGASEGLKDGRIAPSFPASIPSATCCGGTRLTASNSRYEGEAAWGPPFSKRGATGGGVSCYFPLPAYQREMSVPLVPKLGARPGFEGRGIPDVAGVADPDTGYLIFVNGEWTVKGGTSAVAPLWAALIAIINQRLGRRVGFLNPVLYSLRGGDVLRQIISGQNGYYHAGPGWNACTGLGSPIGSALLNALEAHFTSESAKK